LESAREINLVVREIIAKGADRFGIGQMLELGREGLWKMVSPKIKPALKVRTSMLLFMNSI